MLGRGGRLLRRVVQLRLPADLSRLGNRELLAHGDRVRATRQGFERYVSSRRGGLLRRLLAFTGAACTLVGGLDLAWQLLGDRSGMLDPRWDAAVTMAGFLALLTTWLLGLALRRWLRRALGAIDALADEQMRVDDEIQARLLGHRHAPRR